MMRRVIPEREFTKCDRCGIEREDAPSMQYDGGYACVRLYDRVPACEGEIEVSLDLCPECISSFLYWRANPKEDDDEYDSRGEPQ